MRYPDGGGLDAADRARRESAAGRRGDHRGRGLEPERVNHLQLGLAWRVTGILDRWEHPGSPEQMLGKPDLVKWWLLKVSGPLPSRGWWTLTRALRSC